MALCIHCGCESIDDVFCDNCGKLMSENKVATQFDSRKYKDQMVACISRLSNMEKEDVKYRGFELIETPVSIIKSTNDDYKSEVCFVKNDDISLEDYLTTNSLSKGDVSTILYRIYCIMSEVQEKDFVLGSIDLCDLWIKEGNLSTLYYRQTRKFIKSKSDLFEDELGEIEGIQMIDENNEVDKRMDVTLLGRIFMKLATEMKYEFEDYFHERYVAYNMQLFSKIVEKEMNIWLEKTINLNEDKLYSNIDECIEAFNWLQAPKCLDEVPNETLDVEACWVTDVGIGKNEKMQHVPESERNEDSVLVEEVIEKIDGEEFITKALFLVADGVSTCDVGTGKKASNILRDVSSRLWNEMFDDINDVQTVQEFVNTVVQESNEQIWDYVSEFVDNEVGVNMPMATTMSMAIKIKDKLYYASMGDSPIMLLNDNGFIPLTLDDNKGNENLVKGCSWTKFSNMDGASTLTKCVGGKNCIPGNESNTSVKVSEINVVEGEMLLICSDGLTDYIGAGLDIDIEWKKKELLESLLREDKELEDIVDDLVEVANFNGGGDNITVILAKFN